MNIKTAVVSLGCDKNRVDSENMMAYLLEKGFEITLDFDTAEVIIVNTCGFIDSAKNESIENILEMSGYKEDGNCKLLVVTGCLSQRYSKDLCEGIPEIDILVGTGSYKELPDLILERLQKNDNYAEIKDINYRCFTQNRVLSTPSHYAYLKIAEGCDNFCTYCAIPKIRGRFTSRDMQTLIDESKSLISNYGVKELILVAQDVSRYGIDLYGKVSLIELLEELSKLDFKWIRLLYLYPEMITDELLDYIAKNDKILNYLDIPCQHISSKILKMMNRKSSKEDIIKLIDRIRQRGDFTIRSTFIVGFPGETQEDFEELKDFILAAKLDRCGFFAYSREENTPAYNFENQIDEDIKQERVATLYEIQQNNMLESIKTKIGKTFEVIYEGIDYDREMFYGRTKADSPDIDSLVYFTADKPLDIGNYYNVKITGNDDIDLIGECNEFTD